VYEAEVEECEIPMRPNIQSRLFPCQIRRDMAYANVEPTYSTMKS